MPYSSEHKARTRQKIVAAARRLFNRRGFAEVSIDEVMAEAGLTRGGFYNHFQRKQDLYAEVVSHILRCGPGEPGGAVMREPRQLVVDYLSDRHAGELDYSCPLITFSSDVARSDECVKQAYTQVLDSLIHVLQRDLGDDDAARARAVTMATLCVGGAMLARAVDDPELGREIRRIAQDHALGIIDAAAPKRAAA